jgi:hypothetical protein
MQHDFIARMRTVCLRALQIIPYYVKICINLAQVQCLPTSHGPLNPQVQLENEARLESEREEKNVPSPEIQFANVAERRIGSEYNERGGFVLLAVRALQDA